MLPISKFVNKSQNTNDSITTQFALFCGLDEMILEDKLESLDYEVEKGDNGIGVLTVLDGDITGI